MSSTKADEINEFIDTCLEELGAEDTPENRLAALEGLKRSWDEDTDDCIEKAFYMLALNSLIFGNRLRLLFPRITV